MLARILRKVFARSAFGAASRVLFGSLAMVLAAAAAVGAAERDDLGAALVGAASKGDVAAVRRLLGQGADPHAASTEGIPALTTASAAGFTEVAELLIDFGADVDRTGKVSTALMKAVTMHREKTVRALLAGGADVRQTTQAGNTALHEAATRKSAAIVQALAGAG
ncbi:MAG: ankyrin repeat domain-containing protein, partial [Planctomycetota bacterium]